MADQHEEDIDVDYEGEDDDVEDAADADAGGAAAAELLAAAAKPGAGDSETDDDEEDAGPAPAPNATGGDGDKKAGGGEKGAGDSETESEEEGEVEKRGEGDETKGTPRGDNGKADARGPPPSRMDRALDAPRETPSDKRRGDERRGDARDPREERGRGSRWGDRNDNNRGGRWGERHDNRGGPMGQEPRERASVYVPPAKRRLLEAQRKAQEEAEAAKAKEVSGEFAGSPKKEVTPIHVQRKTWEELQRCINGTINRLSPATIKPLIHSLFSEANLIRGRGILCRGILRASSASPQYAPTYAALMAVVNTKLPECGELLLTRAILAFRRGYKRRDRAGVSSALALLGHLFNQGMAHELLSLQVLTVLLDGDPTEDSVDVAVGYMCVVGKRLSEVSPAGVRAVVERFRGLLHEGSVGRRAQYRIETLLKIKRGGFVDYPTIPDEDELDLVEREDQITFELGLDDEGLKSEDSLDTFRYDEEYDEKEEEWKNIKAEILGEDSDSDSGSSSGSGSDSESESEEEKEEVPDQQLAGPGDKKTVVIEDLTETDLVHLRRTIYLTIMSSATFEECTHKLAKMDIPDGRESELINMIIECCSQERTFLRYYGLVSGRFCLLHERWQSAFEEAFAAQYNTIHRLETNKLRNVAKLFGHLLHTDSVSWSVLGCIHLNEDETTSSSRIFIKILVQEMAEAMGMVTLKRRFDTDNPDPDGPVGEVATDALAVRDANRGGHNHQQEVSSREWFRGMFPKDNARNTRYAINFFTSIGLGPLTDGMREFLKNAPKLILAQAQAQAAKEAAAKDDDESSVISTSSSDTSSVSSSSGSSTSSSSRSSYSSSSSDSRYRRRRRGGRRRSRSYSSSSSSSSSGSDSSRSREGRRGRRGSSGNKRGRRDDRSDGASSGGAPTPDAGSRRRSVSVSRSRSPPSRKRGCDRRGGPSSSPEDARRGEGRGRKRRSSRPSSSASRSRSPPKRRRSSGGGDGRRGGRGSGGRSASSGRN